MDAQVGTRVTETVHQQRQTNMMLLDLCIAGFSFLVTLGLTLLYAVTHASENESMWAAWLPLGLLLTIIIPLIVFFLLQKWWKALDSMFDM